MTQDQQKNLLMVLAECAAACDHCAIACLDEPEVKMLTHCIKLDLDCAEICRTTASFVARGSSHAKHLLKECAEICEACGAECEKHAAHGMEHCRVCAEACKRCAVACTQAGADINR
jgi:hypothetical protein